MDLALTESQEMLRTAARTFMEREAPVDVVVSLQKAESSLEPGLWRKAAQLGWLGILIPTEYGGSGDRLSDAAVLYEELGRGPLPGPFFSSGVLGALTVLEGASEEQRRRLLPGVASGERVLTVAITEPNASWGPAGITLTPQGKNGGYTLNGTKLFVSDATSATDLVVAVRTGEGTSDVSLLHVDARARGVTARRLPGFLSWQCEVSFDNVEVPRVALLGDANRGWAALTRALERALPLLCAYIVGACQAVYEKSVLYMQTRVQLGVPIEYLAPERADEREMGGYRIDRKAFFLPDPKLLPEEAAALYAQRSANLGKGRPRAFTWPRPSPAKLISRPATPPTRCTRAWACSSSTGWRRTRRCRGRCSTSSATRGGTSGGWPTRSSGSAYDSRARAISSPG